MGDRFARCITQKAIEAAAEGARQYKFRPVNLSTTVHSGRYFHKPCLREDFQAFDFVCCTISDAFHPIFHKEPWIQLSHDFLPGSLIVIYDPSTNPRIWVVVLVIVTQRTTIGLTGNSRVRAAQLINGLVSTLEYLMLCLKIDNIPPLDAFRQRNPRKTCL